jgi:NTE family protein
MPKPSRRTPRRGLVIGCGGTLGFAWTAMALEALEHELGWDARTADVLVGTSAGSELVAMLGAGRSVSEIVAALERTGGDPVLSDHLSHHPGMLPPRPGLRWPALGLVARGLRREVDLTAALAGLLPAGRGDAGWLRELGDRLAGESGWVPHPATWIVAADASTGSRVAFGTPEAPRVGLGEAIAASWAIPGWFPPVRAAGHRYVDGGTVSTASLDLVLPLDLDEVVVLAPMASHEPAAASGVTRVERILRLRMTAGLDREADLVRRSGTSVIRIEPTQEDLDAMGANFMDVRRRDGVLKTAARTSPTRVREAIAAANQGAAV